jgi:hypothetical protein
MACQRLGSGRFAISAMSGGATAVTCPVGSVAMSSAAGTATSDSGGTTFIDGVYLEANAIQLNAGETGNPWNGRTVVCNYFNTTVSTAYGVCHAICCRIQP